MYNDRQYHNHRLLYVAAKCASAIAIPTAIAIPCPSGPVVASTPTV